MTGKRVLMVEGPDDEHVVKAICGKRQLGTIDLIKSYGGKPGLLEGIPVRLMESDIGAVGILLDADEDLDASWQAIAGFRTCAGPRRWSTPGSPGRGSRVSRSGRPSRLVTSTLICQRPIGSPNG
jgi:hypothetical protein